MADEGDPLLCPRRPSPWCTAVRDAAWRVGIIVAAVTWTLSLPALGGTTLPATSDGGRLLVPSGATRFGP